MLKFKNNRFVILQISDCQDLHNVRRTMLRMLEIAYDRVKPDLVVFTGDNILGNHLCDARFGNKKVVKTRAEELARMKKAIDNILRSPENRKIPFTMIYGNHDDMNSFTKEEQAELYRAYSMCCGVDGETEPGTFNLPIYSDDEKKPLFNLWFMDSAWQDKKSGVCYTAVKKEAVEWYEKKSAEFKEQNGGRPLPSIMFQHIAMPETAELMEECGGGDSGALFIKDKDGHGRFVRLSPEKADGVIYEPISGCAENYGQFAALKSCGDVKAVVYGHEHKNNYVGELEGIKIIQSSAASFRCYGNQLRGVRVFVIDENNTENIKTYFLTYDELCGRGVLSHLRYIWDADGMGAQKAALITALGIAAAAGIAAGCRLGLNERKRK